MGIHQDPPSASQPESQPKMPLTSATDPYEVFRNLDGATPLELGPDAKYTVSEHILWAPRKIRVASIGAGASGIMLCYKKEKEFGDDIDLVVYERHPEPGGVWYANRYPGCRCDVPSPAYQFSFAPKPDWPMFYSDADQIRQYYSEYAHKQGYVGKYIKLKHELTSAVWDEAAGQWVLTVVETMPSGEKREFQDRIEVLVGNVGVLHSWQWPSIPKREEFKGVMTHSAAYDTSIDLVGKKVAVIGSGASAVQIVPAIADKAAHVTSFYRTPQWISPGMTFEELSSEEGNFKFTKEQQDKFRDDPEYYLKIRKSIEKTINGSFPVMLKTHPFQISGREKLEERMKNILNNDAKLTSKLVPDFAMGCRRLGTGEDFLRSLMTDKVSLAESQIQSFTETGVLCQDGTALDFDVIICATGFDVSFRPPFDCIGRDNRNLRDEWTSNPEAYLALAAAGYPNFFIGSLGPNCPAGHGSFVTVLESAQNYICKVIRKMQTENIMAIDIKRDAVREYNEHVHIWLKRTVWAAGCRSWFNQGNPDAKLTAQYPGSLMHWRSMCKDPRFEDYDIKYRSVNRFKFMGNGFIREEVDGSDLSYYLDPEEIAKPLFDH